jgi:IMP and pyridine-specific 5'-nucleotidase
MTLYADGANFSEDSKLVALILRILKQHIHIAIVTAAGYGDNNEPYEKRLSGLLDGFKISNIPKSDLANFYVLGGECNFLFRYSPDVGKLVYLQPETYQPKSIACWLNDTSRITKFLDVAEHHLNACAIRMSLQNSIKIIRKSKAVGMISIDGVSLTREQLDEFSLTTKNELNRYQYIQSKSQKDLLDIPEALPFCSFNGGSDVWVDIGNKFM